MIGLQIYKGRVAHVRTQPKAHRFSYKMLQFWLDVEQPELVDQASIWWSSTRPNLVRFNEQDYLPGAGTLLSRVAATIHRQTGNRFQGKAYLLGSFRMWGYCYNPVAFYCCYEKGLLKYLISEVHNTPWGERFCYVDEIGKQDGSAEIDELQVASFDKAFHVSPFMPMKLQYQWRYRVREHAFYMRMNLLEDRRSIFNATLKLHAVPLTRKAANRVPFKFPFMCVGILGAIYWQALKLWFKGLRFFPNPNPREGTG